MDSAVIVVARGSRMLHIAVYNPTDNQWTKGPQEAHFTDAEGWGLPEYYETFCAAACAGKLYVGCRGSTGIDIQCFKHDIKNTQQVALITLA